jgi:lipoate-protein ligase A
VEALGFDSRATVSAIAVYERVARGFLCAFAEMGLLAAMGTCCQERTGETRGDCFAIVSRADIIEAETGRKLLGSALHRRDRWLLQQMSLPLFPFQPVERAEAHAALCRELFRGAAADYRPAFVQDRRVENVAEALLRGLADMLGGVWKQGEAAQAEQERARQLCALRYACPDWMQGLPAAKSLFDR